MLEDYLRKDDEEPRKLTLLKKRDEEFDYIFDENADDGLREKKIFDFEKFKEKQKEKFKDLDDLYINEGKAKTNIINENIFKKKDDLAYDHDKEMILIKEKIESQVI